MQFLFSLKSGIEKLCFLNDWLWAWLRLSVIQTKGQTYVDVPAFDPID